MGNSGTTDKNPGPDAADRKPGVVLCSDLDAEQSTRVTVLLQAMGLEPALVQRPGSTRFEVRVHEREASAARALLREEFPYGFSPGVDQVPPRPTDDPRISAPSGWFGRGGEIVLLLVAACVGVYAYAHLGLEGGSRSRLLEAGAASFPQIQQGEYWRLLSAVFLHFGSIHLLTNMATLLVVGPPLAHLVGARRFAVIFILSGIGGNLLSHEMTPSLALKAGASGAIAGVLGALGGQALRPRDSRYKNWQVLGALAAVYGLLIGFGPGRDNTAHLGGFLAGLLLGRINPPLPESTPRAVAPGPPHPPRSA